jgi:cephalosporin hydroxylase
LAGSPHPWLVIEDSAHTYESVHAVLDYFDQMLLSGDYIVVEDGVVADLRGQAYLQYADGPNMAVADFLLDKGARFKIDSDTCDYFGSNVTYCPNAWLVRQ